MNNEQLLKRAEEACNARMQRKERLYSFHEKMVEGRKVSARREEHISRLISDERIRHMNRLRRIKEDKQGVMALKKLRIFSAVIALFIVLLITLELALPKSQLRRSGIITDKEFEKAIDDANYKEYAKLENKTEEKLLWELLTEHFGGNKNAVLGVMCNLKAESGIVAANLEDLNNEMWSVDDSEYTDDVNRRRIRKKDFVESRNNDMTNGYYNEYDKWVNIDGGYGYAQFTAYENKDELYRFAEQWFAPNGGGEGYAFNIGDPEMQANYIVYLLSSDRYEELDKKLRSSTSVADACYLWLADYERPYDPYEDDYYTLSFERASWADEIEEACKDR